MILKTGPHWRILLLLIWACQGPAVAENPEGANAVASDLSVVATPAPGSPVRKAILEALREEVRRLYGLEVVFVVDELKVKGDWAWVQTLPQSKDGQSHYEGIPALMQRRDGVWTVAELVCTEVDNPECIDFPDYFARLIDRFPGVPEEILPAIEETEREMR